MSRISHIEIYVSQYAKSLRFYDMILFPMGWKRLVCMKSHAAYTDGESKLIFCPTEERFLNQGFHRKRIGLNHIAFYTSSKEAVDEFYENVLKKNQIECLYDQGPSGDSDYYAVFFEDPDRIKIEIVFSPDYCSEQHWTNKLENDFDPYAEV